MSKHRFNKNTSLQERVQWFIDHSIWDDECLICNESPDNVGYPRFVYKGKMMYLLRVIPILQGYNVQGLDIRHTCNKRNCINKEHLIPGTHFKNMRDIARSDIRYNLHPSIQLKHKGVYLCKTTSKYLAQISINKKKYNLGRYTDEEQAAQAFKLALDMYELYGILPDKSYSRHFRLKSRLLFPQNVPDQDTIRKHFKIVEV